MINIEEKINTIRTDISELNRSIQKQSPETVIEEVKVVKKLDLEKKSFALKKFQSILGYQTYKQREKVALRTIDSSNSSPGNITIGSVAQNGTYTSGAGNLGNATATASIRVGIPANITSTYDFDTKGNKP